MMARPCSGHWARGCASRGSLDGGGLGSQVARGRIDAVHHRRLPRDARPVDPHNAWTGRRASLRTGGSGTDRTMRTALTTADLDASDLLEAWGTAPPIISSDWEPVGAGSVRAITRADRSRCAGHPAFDIRAVRSRWVIIRSRHAVAERHVVDLVWHFRRISMRQAGTVAAGQEGTPTMQTVHRWTGKEARALRTALRLTVRDFAERLGVAVRTISKWEAGGSNVVPRPDTQAILDTALGHAASDAKLRFETLRQEREQAPLSPEVVQHSADDVLVPATTLNGGTVFVAVSRRAALKTMGMASLTAAAGMPEMPPSAKADLGEMAPVVHFIEMKRVLMDSDNLFGSRQVVRTVIQQIETLERIAHDAPGSQRAQLVTIQAQFADLASWLQQDAANYAGANSWIDNAVDCARFTGDNQAVAFLLARKSQIAGDRRDGASAVALSQAAIELARHRTRAAVIAHTYQAHGHALLGDESACRRAFDTALDGIADLDEDPAFPYGLFLDEAYIAVQRARSFDALGCYAQAVTELRDKISLLPSGYKRDRGVYLAWAAHAHLGNRELAETAEFGEQSLRIARETDSRRIVVELARLRDRVPPNHSDDRVRKFRALLCSYRDEPHSRYEDADPASATMEGRS